MTNQGSTLQQQATKLREDATTRDHIAKDVEDRLQSGQPFKFQLVDDRMGESITLDVPAGPPPYVATAPTPTIDVGATGVPIPPRPATAAADAGRPRRTTCPLAPTVPTAPTDRRDRRHGRHRGTATADPLLGDDDITGAAPAPVAASDTIVDTAPFAPIPAPAAADDGLIAADNIASGSQELDSAARRLRRSPTPSRPTSPRREPTDATVDGSADDSLDA